MTSSPDRYALGREFEREFQVRPILHCKDIVQLQDTCICLLDLNLGLREHMAFLAKQEFQEL